jgi:hypothetical protein
MSSRLERARKRKKIKNNINVFETSNSEDINGFLNSKLDNESVNEVYKQNAKHYDMSVSEAEASAFLIKFKKDFNQERFDKLVIDCKKDVINSIVTPFGLGKIVAAYDKVGGNVDTIHNARNGIYATDEAKINYENRTDYDSDKYHSHKNYKVTNEQAKTDKLNDDLTDEFGSKTFKRNETTNLDHTISAKEVSDDAGRELANLDGVTLANESSNLNITTPEFNNFKRAKTMEQAILDLDKELKLLNNKSDLTENDKTRLKKLNKIDEELDRDKALEADTKVREDYNKKINKEYYTSAKFVKNTISTGATEGLKMGTQQALGLLMSEFFTAVFDEIMDIYKNGYSTSFDDDRFFNVLKERFKNIAKKIKAKWKDVATAFKDGFISGFISNLVTTAINMFVSTGKRVVRIIREGIFSLFKAIKLLIFPPEGMSYEDAMHEAKKLLATGLIVSLGVIAEQYIDAMIKTTVVLEPFADILTTVFVGAITGLAITMTVYHIDKKKNDKDAIKLLVTQTNKSFDNIDEMTNFRATI